MNKCVEHDINKIIRVNIENNLIDSNNISDGYHTFGELYDHRCALFIALCNHLFIDVENYASVWKSKKHHDGSEIEGWFIMGINEKPGKQITYHLPIKLWDKCKVMAYDIAPYEWDGHTPDDVIKRLYEL